ncbi:MAG: hypothetical protein ACOCWG_04190, partial [bacterium]
CHNQERKKYKQSKPKKKNKQIVGRKPKFLSLSDEIQTYIKELHQYGINLHKTLELTKEKYPKLQLSYQSLLSAKRHGFIRSKNEAEYDNEIEDIKNDLLTKDEIKEDQEEEEKVYRNIKRKPIKIATKKRIIKPYEPLSEDQEEEEEEEEDEDEDEDVKKLNYYIKRVEQKKNQSKYTTKPKRSIREPEPEPEEQTEETEYTDETEYYTDY